MLCFWGCQFLPQGILFCLSNLTEEEEEGEGEEGSLHTHLAEPVDGEGGGGLHQLLPSESVLGRPCSAAHAEPIIPCLAVFLNLPYNALSYHQYRVQDAQRVAADAEKNGGLPEIASRKNRQVPLFCVFANITCPPHQSRAIVWRFRPLQQLTACARKVT